MLLCGRELPVLVQEIISAFPVVMSLRDRGDVGLGGDISLIAVSLMTQVDPFGWFCAMVFFIPP